MSFNELTFRQREALDARANEIIRLKEDAPTMSESELEVRINNCLSGIQQERSNASSDMYREGNSPYSSFSYDNMTRYETNMEIYLSAFAARLHAQGRLEASIGKLAEEARHIYPSSIVMAKLVAFQKFSRKVQEQKPAATAAPTSSEVKARLV